MKYNIQIQVRNYGNINLEVNGEVAPISAENFISLVRSGFYDGLTFHRIIDGFMIQGGDPTGTGTGGSDNKIKGEFEANGVKNTLSHTRGCLSMARSADMNSARSQFFIVHKDSLFLDGQYAGFGMVTSGIEVVDAIVAGTKISGSNGSVNREDQPVIEKIIVL